MLVEIPSRLRVVSWTVVAACFCASASASQASKSEETRVEVVEGLAVALPSPWFLADRMKNAVEIAYPRSPRRSPVSATSDEKPATADELVTAEARTVVTVEVRRDHKEAVSRLGQIAAGRNEKVQWIVVSGWPGMIRQYKAQLPAPGGTSQGDSTNLALHLSISLAVESMVVRLETVLAPGADPKLLQEAQDIAYQLQVRAGDPTAAQRDVSRLSALASR
jgi:hypothetical protein